MHHFTATYRSVLFPAKPEEKQLLWFGFCKMLPNCETVVRHWWVMRPTHWLCSRHQPAGHHHTMQNAITFCSLQFTTIQSVDFTCNRPFFKWEISINLPSTNYPSLLWKTSKRSFHILHILKKAQASWTKGDLSIQAMSSSNLEQISALRIRLLTTHVGRKIRFAKQNMQTWW